MKRINKSLVSIVLFTMIIICGCASNNSNSYQGFTTKDFLSKHYWYTYKDDATDYYFPNQFEFKAGHRPNYHNLYSGTWGIIAGKLQLREYNPNICVTYMTIIEENIDKHYFIVRREFEDGSYETGYLFWLSNIN